jgi:GWxTD domain-containing protein
MNNYGDGYTLPEQYKIAVSEKQAEIPLDYCFYYPDSNHTNLYYKVDTKHLLFEPNPMNVREISARARISIAIFNSPNDKKELYKKSSMFESTSQKLIYDSLVLRHEWQDVYYELTISDLNKHTNDKKTGWIYKKTNPNAQEVLFYTDSADFPLFPNQLTKKIGFVRSELLENRSLKLQRYEHLQTTAIPPFANRHEEGFVREDSSFSLVKGHIWHAFSQVQNAFIAVFDSNSKKELSAVCIDTTDSLSTYIAALQYISTRDEFKLLAEGKNKQEEYLRFWRERSAQNTAKAQKLSILFAQRIDYANAHFTSYKPGWQTDCGMIYLVFGPAIQIEEDEQTLTWHYGGFSFKFDAMPWLGTKNNYVLQRSVNYKAYWYQAVENWRAGNILTN